MQGRSFFYCFQFNLEWSEADDDKPDGITAWIWIIWICYLTAGLSRNRNSIIENKHKHNSTQYQYRERNGRKNFYLELKEIFRIVAAIKIYKYIYF